MTVERIRCGGLLALSLLAGLVLALPARASLFTFSVDSPVTFNDASGGSLQLLAFSSEFTGAEPGVGKPSPNIYQFPAGALNADGVSYTIPDPFPGSADSDSDELSVSLSVSHNGETVSQNVVFGFGTDNVRPSSLISIAHVNRTGVLIPDFIFSDGITRLQIGNISGFALSNPAVPGATFTFDLNAEGMTFIVPEPATLTVLGAALVGLAAVRRRRRPAA